MINDEKELRKILLFLLIFCCALFGIVVNLVSNGPSMYCEKLGGEYYSNGKCYFVKNMDSCIDEYARIHQKSNLEKMSSNFSIISAK